MAKKNKKVFKSNLKLEALEQRQLLAGVTGSGTELTPGGAGVNNFITAPNGNKYDQVLLTGTSVSVTNDTGTITRVSFLDLQGDIVQAEFSGAGTLTVSMDAASAKASVQPTNYIQTLPGGAGYEQGLATFSIQGSDSTTNFTVFSVGSATAVNQSLFDATHKGGNNTADVQRITIVSNPANPNGSDFGGIRAGNAIFTDNNGVTGGTGGVVGITAANVQVQDVVTVGDIVASGSATPTLVFGQSSQFGNIALAGGGLVSPNGKAINNTNSYNFGVTFAPGQKADGTNLPAQSTSSQIAWTGNNATAPVTRTFSLTTGIDNLTGTAGDDTFSALNTTASPVIGALDTIAGGGGKDTLNISDATGTAPLGSLVVSGVSVLNLTSTAGLGSNSSLDTTGWGLTTSTSVLQNIGNTAQSYTASGTTAVNITSSAPLAADGSAGAWSIKGGSTITLNDAVSRAGATNVGTGTVTVTGVAGTTSVTVKQSGKNGTGNYGAVNVTDLNGGDSSKTNTITTVSLDGVDNASTIKSAVLNSLTLANTTTTITLTDPSSAHAATGGATVLAVSINNSTGGGSALTDSKGTIKEIDFTTVSKDSALVVSTTNNVLTTIKVAGSNKLDFGSTNTFGTGFANLSTSGAASVVASVANNVVVDTTASTGTASLTLAGTGGTTKAIVLGAGNDTVTPTLASGALGTGGSINGGGGTNTLQLSYTDAVAGSAATTLGGQISNFQKLSLKGGTVPAAGLVQLPNLLGINNISLDAAAGNSFTLQNVGSNPTLTITAAQGAANTITIVDPLAAIQNEALNLTLSSKNSPLTTGTIDSQGIQTVNLVANDTNSPTTNQIDTIASLSGASLRTINVSGTAGVTISGTGTAVSTVDASGLSKAGLTLTTGALTNASTIKGTDKGDTITVNAASPATTITSGNGNNTINALSTANNSVTLGNGNNTVNVGSGNNTVVVGTGANTVDLNSAGNTGANTVTLGSGVDTVNVGTPTGQTVINLGSSQDTVVFKGTPAQSGYYVTLNGAVDGDKLNFATINTGGTLNQTKVTLGQGVAFTDYLNAAAAGTTAGGANTLRWFQFGGDTYVVSDNNTATTFTAGTDSVVRLAGLIDLSAANTNVSSAAGVITI